MSVPWLYVIYLFLSHADDMLYFLILIFLNKISLEQGLELDDFVSGPRELLLKFVEENYPLPEKPETLPGMCGLCSRVYILLFSTIGLCFIIDFSLEEGSVKELQRKRHSATPGISLNGRLRKAAKWKPPSDVESDEESECGLFNSPS